MAISVTPFRPQPAGPSPRRRQMKAEIRAILSEAKPPAGVLTFQNNNERFERLLDRLAALLTTNEVRDAN